MRKNFLALIAAAALLTGMSACTSESDNPAKPTPSQAEIPAQLKQGVWTEYDTTYEAYYSEEDLDLEALEGYSEEELDEISALGMFIDGDKAYFFTYTAEGADDLVEGAISYDSTTGTGTIAFPAIADSPLSGQTVSFTAITDEVIEFELTYEGKKTTAICVWLCENLDNWDTEITDEDWRALIAYYEQYAADAGPDPSIDWGNLDEPLVWDEGASTRGNTRGVGDGVECVSAGLDIFTSLFEPDPAEEINNKLDGVLRKLESALTDQQNTAIESDKVNDRLNSIAKTMKKGNIQDIFNNRNDKYYNPLKEQNTQYFDKAFSLYANNKGDLNKVSAELGEYAKSWVSNNEEYINLTWNYIEYLSTVQTSTYGTSMAKIYDGLTFDKYPWEHLGTGDRLCYRAYDMFEISKCLFMINLYAAYGGLTDDKKTAIYNNYNDSKPQLKAFCEFKVANPNKFLVCQIPGAHFVMHKELQKYNYCAENNKAPNPRIPDVAYRPEWHEKGDVRIENPIELKSKLIRCDEANAIYNYYKSAVYPKENNIWWMNMLVKDNNIADKDSKAGGAVYAQAPTDSKDTKPTLLLFTEKTKGPNRMGLRRLQSSSYIVSMIQPTWQNATPPSFGLPIGNWVYQNIQPNQIVYWNRYDPRNEFYAAIVQERY